MTAVACVLGSVDLVQALGRAGLPTVVFTGQHDPLRWSSHVQAVHDAPGDFASPDRLARDLMEFAAGQPERPVLYPQSDSDLQMLLAHRSSLEAGFRLLLPASDLLADLLDKTRFAALAERCGLAVLRSAVVSRAIRETDLRFPALVKPRDKRGLALLPSHGKAVSFADADALSRWAAELDDGVEALAQELVPGPESRVESYHAYVDRDGHVVGEFTGAKIRTWPTAYGMSSALVTTRAPDVVAAGRDLVERTGLRGVLKVDLKRDPAGRLWVLEVNPRFTLWCSLGALGGTNLPALVHADLTGAPRPPAHPVPPGLTWCHPLRDAFAARASGLDLRSWLRFVRGADLLCGVEGRDPRPLLLGMLLPTVRTRLGARRAAPAPLGSRS